MQSVHEPSASTVSSNNDKPVGGLKFVYFEVRAGCGAESCVVSSGVVAAASSSTDSVVEPPVQLLPTSVESWMAGVLSVGNGTESSDHGPSTAAKNTSFGVAVVRRRGQAHNDTSVPEGAGGERAAAVVGGTEADERIQQREVNDDAPTVVGLIGCCAHPFMAGATVVPRGSAKRERAEAPSTDLPAACRPHELYITFVGVRLDERGNGLARRLLSALLFPNSSSCATKPPALLSQCTRCRLHVACDNSAALGLYQGPPFNFGVRRKIRGYYKTTSKNGNNESARCVSGSSQSSDALELLRKIETTQVP